MRLRTVTTPPRYLCSTHTIDGATDDVAVHLSVGCPANSPTRFYTPSGRTTPRDDSVIPSLKRATLPAASEPWIELVGSSLISRLSYCFVR